MKKEKRPSKKKDMTKYGEFVCSTFHWLPIEQQKQQAKRLESITKKENKKD